MYLRSALLVVIICSCLLVQGQVIPRQEDMLEVARELKEDLGIIRNILTEIELSAADQENENEEELGREGKCSPGHFMAPRCGGNSMLGCVSVPEGCAVPRISETQGRLECAKCRPGFFLDPMRTFCVECGGGRDIINGVCKCPPGREYEVNGICLPCPPYMALNEQQECTPCREPAFHIVDGVCVPCEDPFTTEYSYTSCMCANSELYIGRFEGNMTTSCIPCLKLLHDKDKCRCKDHEYLVLKQEKDEWSSRCVCRNLNDPRCEKNCDDDTRPCACAYPKELHNGTCECRAPFYEEGKTGNCVLCDPATNVLEKYESKYGNLPGVRCVPRFSKDKYLSFKNGKMLAENCTEDKNQYIEENSKTCVECPRDHIVLNGRCVGCHAKPGFYLDTNRNVCTKCELPRVIENGACKCLEPFVVFEEACVPCSFLEPKYQRKANCRTGFHARTTDDCQPPKYVDEVDKLCRSACSSLSEQPKCLGHTTVSLASSNRFTFYDNACDSANVPGCFNVDGIEKKCRYCQIVETEGSLQELQAEYTPRCPVNVDQCWAEKGGDKSCDNMHGILERIPLCIKYLKVRDPLNNCQPSCKLCDVNHPIFIGCQEIIALDAKKCLYKCSECKPGFVPAYRFFHESRKSEIGLSMCVMKYSKVESIFEEHDVCKKHLFPLTAMTDPVGDEVESYGNYEAAIQCLRAPENNPKFGLYNIFSFDSCYKADYYRFDDGCHGSPFCVLCSTDVAKTTKGSFPPCPQNQQIRECHTYLTESSQIGRRPWESDNRESLTEVGVLESPTQNIYPHLTGLTWRITDEYEMEFIESDGVVVDIAGEDNFSECVEMCKVDRACVFVKFFATNHRGSIGPYCKLYNGMRNDMVLRKKPHQQVSGEGEKRSSAHLCRLLKASKNDQYVLPLGEKLYTAKSGHISETPYQCCTTCKQHSACYFFHFSPITGSCTFYGQSKVSFEFMSEHLVYGQVGTQDQYADAYLDESMTMDLEQLIQFQQPLVVEEPLEESNGRSSYGEDDDKFLFDFMNSPSVVHFHGHPSSPLRHSQPSKAMPTNSEWTNLLLSGDISPEGREQWTIYPIPYHIKIEKSSLTFNRAKPSSTQDALGIGDRTDTGSEITFLFDKSLQMTMKEHTELGTILKWESRVVHESAKGFPPSVEAYIVAGNPFVTLKFVNTALSIDFKLCTFAGKNDLVLPNSSKMTCLGALSSAGNEAIMGQSAALNYVFYFENYNPMVFSPRTKLQKKYTGVVRIASFWKNTGVGNAEKFDDLVTEEDMMRILNRHFRVYPLKVLSSFARASTYGTSNYYIKYRYQTSVMRVDQSVEAFSETSVDDLLMIRLEHHSSLYEDGELGLEVVVKKKVNGKSRNIVVAQTNFLGDSNLRFVRVQRSGVSEHTLHSKLDVQDPLFSTFPELVVPTNRISKDTLKSEVCALLNETFELSKMTVYEGGQRVYRAARLVYLTQQYYPNEYLLKRCVHNGPKDPSRIVIDQLTHFFSSSMIYDHTWKGIYPTSQSEKKFARSTSDILAENEGLGTYTGMHFQYGYWVHALAYMLRFVYNVLSRKPELPPVITYSEKQALDREMVELLAPLTAYWSIIYAVIRSFVNPFTESSRPSNVRNQFPSARHMDHYRFHSYSLGIVYDRDGRMQDSSGEAVNAYLGAARIAETLEMMASVLDANQALIPKEALRLAQKVSLHSKSLLAMETKASKLYWQRARHYQTLKTISNDSPKYLRSPSFSELIQYTLPSVVWSNKFENYPYTESTLYEIRVDKLACGNTSSVLHAVNVAYHCNMVLAPMNDFVIREYSAKIYQQTFLNIAMEMWSHCFPIDLQIAESELDFLARNNLFWGGVVFQAAVYDNESRPSHVPPEYLASWDSHSSFMSILYHNM
eukprot:Nk52_evm28s1837 gene=Nk52_evmTU28s1837